MSWAMSFSADKSDVITDTYHRLGVEVLIQKILEPIVFETLMCVIDAGISHVMIVVDEDSSNSKLPLQEIKDSCSQLSHRFAISGITFTLSFKSINSQTPIIIQIFRPHICFLPYNTDRHRTLEEFSELLNALPSDTLQSVAFGISGVPERDLQYCIELLLSQLPKPIEFLDHLDVPLPNLKLRANELGHSRNLISMIHLPSVDINFVKPSKESVISFECILGFSNEYKKHPVAILVKALLQFGYCVILPITLPKDFLTTELAQLTHPFIHRRQFFSAVEIKRFVISLDHMQEIAFVSEDKESEVDEYWKEYATFSAPPMILTSKAPEKYFKPNTSTALLASNSNNSRKGKV